jgi:hypothetical protein
VDPRLPASLPRACLTACALTWAAGAACSSSATTGAGAATGDDGGRSDAALTDAASTDAAPGDAPRSDGAPGPGSDGSSDARPADAAPSVPVPSCKSGDRAEWSGPVGSTGIALAVCSVCGASYVVAANGNAAAGEVSLDNGSKTITLAVPAGGTATSATLTDDPADGTVTVCATAPSHACLPSAPQNQRYCDPYRDVTNLTPERIDQGVDYGGSGPIYAMGPGTIDLYYNRTDTGWPGGTFVSYKLVAGPAAGREIYLAENIDLDTGLKAGSFVFSGTVLGTQVDASPESESGWGVAGKGYTAEYGCYTEGCMTPLGVNFNALLVCLKAPSGISGAGGCCPQPTGWPTDWCATLAAWQ